MRDASYVRSLPLVGAIATIPSRVESFADVLSRLVPQVDHLFVYLDGHAAAPSALKQQSKLTIFHAEKCGNLHASSRLLPMTFLGRPCIFVIFDDDIIYPTDYVETLVEGLAKRGGRAVVGFHGNCFKPPYASYAKDRVNINFKEGLEIDTQVDELGAGTSAFLSENLAIDPREFPYVNMDDLILAIEAERRCLPRICLRRSTGWLAKHPKPQTWNLWSDVLKDDSRETKLLAQLISFSAKKA
jgi:hypothetical protein